MSKRCYHIARDPILFKLLHGRSWDSVEGDRPWAAICNSRSRALRDWSNDFASDAEAFLKNRRSTVSALVDIAESSCLEESVNAQWLQDLFDDDTVTIRDYLGGLEVGQGRRSPRSVLLPRHDDERYKVHLIISRFMHV